MTTWLLQVPNAQTGSYPYDSQIAYDSVLPYDAPSGTGYTVIWLLQTAN